MTCYHSLCFSFIIYEGDDCNDMDLDANPAATDYVDQDPFEFVYSNLPDSTHILKHAYNCLICKAKKIQFETDGFCCRNGQTELLEPEPDTSRTYL
jgi:hypothetical protein